MQVDKPINAYIHRSNVSSMYPYYEGLPVDYEELKQKASHLRLTKWLTYLKTLLQSTFLNFLIGNPFLRFIKKNTYPTLSQIILLFSFTSSSRRVRFQSQSIQKCFARICHYTVVYTQLYGGKKGALSKNQLFLHVEESPWRGHWATGTEKRKKRYSDERPEAIFHWKMNIVSSGHFRLVFPVSSIQ